MYFYLCLHLVSRTFLKDWTFLAEEIPRATGRWLAGICHTVGFKTPEANEQAVAEP
jgi:hypothetical protein